MSALKQVFPRVHFRYDRDAHAADLEQFATWLCVRGNCNKSARTHLYNSQQVLRSLRAAWEQSSTPPILREHFGGPGTHGADINTRARRLRSSFDYTTDSLKRVRRRQTDSEIFAVTSATA
jgi:hypothetical protein